MQVHYYVPLQILYLWWHDKYMFSKYNSTKTTKKVISVGNFCRNVQALSKSPKYQHQNIHKVIKDKSKMQNDIYNWNILTLCISLLHFVLRSHIWKVTKARMEMLPESTSNVHNIWVSALIVVQCYIVVCVCAIKHNGPCFCYTNSASVKCTQFTHCCCWAGSEQPCNLQ